MPKTSSASHRALRGALAGVALAALAPAAGAAPRALAPRAAVVKHTGHELAAGTPVERLVVKFHEGSRVRLRDSGLVALISERNLSERNLFFGRGLSESRLTGDLRSVEALLERVPRTRSVQRLLQEDEALLEARKASGEALSGEQLADLNLYFQVPLLPGTTSERVADVVAALNALDTVEVAYAEPPVEDATVNAAMDAALKSLLAAADLPPATPLYTANQGYLNIAPGGIDAKYAWTVAGGIGTGVRIIDVETGWNRTHEDMPTLVYVGNPGDVRDHGTAVLGELVAANNAYGMTGIVYGAQMGVESHMTQGLTTALSKAVTAAGRGGIVLVEVHRQGPNDGTACTCNTTQCNYIAVEYWQAEYDVIRNATANGVIVVEAAGNGSANLDAAAYGGLFNRATRDSGAIIVGASTATTRAPMCWTNSGSRVDVHGWGERVASMGYGDLFGSAIGVDQYYTSTFSGTSSASPIVTGAAASAQGVARANGRLLTSVQMRGLLRNNGTAQAADTRQIGPLPDLRKVLPKVIAGTY